MSYSLEGHPQTYVKHLLSLPFSVSQQNVYYTSSQQLHLGVLSPTIDDDDNKCLVDVNSRPRLLECSYAATKHMKLTWTFTQVKKKKKKETPKQRKLHNRRQILNEQERQQTVALFPICWTKAGFCAPSSPLHFYPASCFVRAWITLSLFYAIGILKAHLLQLDNELSHIHSF